MTTQVLTGLLLRTADLFQFQQEQVTTAPLTRQADEDDKEWLP